MKKSIFNAVVAAWLTAFSSVLMAEEYSIVISSIPRPVTLSFPAGFMLADSSEARLRRERFLNFYTLNPEYSGNYDDILLLDWSSIERFPQIVVGSLGATSRFQGNISESNWESIRAEFEKATPGQIAKIRDEWRPRIESGSPVPLSTYEELVWLEEQNDPNSITALSHFRTETDGELETTFSARKLMYHDGYMVFANIVVDASKPNALQDIQDYLVGINIESIE